VGDDQFILEQFKRKRADLRCRACGNDGFMLLLPNEPSLKTYFHWQRSETSGEASTGPKLRTISIACDNCGHIEQFLADPLMDRELGERK
jgi:ribosomal protein L37E